MAPCFNTNPFYLEWLKANAAGLSPICTNVVFTDFANWVVLVIVALSVVFNTLELLQNLTVRSSISTMHTMTGYSFFLEWPLLNIKLKELNTIYHAFCLYAKIGLICCLLTDNVPGQMSYLKKSVLMRGVKWLVSMLVLMVRNDGSELGKPIVRDLVQSIVLGGVWLTLTCNAHRHFGSCA